MTTAVEPQTGIERFLFQYQAFPHQLAFHGSPIRHRLLGGAAGPGKTLALIMDHMLHCQRFSAQDAPHVHTLILRRTHPKLEATVITRFREQIPRELYSDYNEQHHVVTWRNGASTQFGSMQHEHDVWGWQGQWSKVGYDELTEFTFYQWQNISAWNRCPVWQWSTKDGATNPIGIGAPWVESLFVKKRPCAEMDQRQRELYDPAEYAYFPATYRDNPIYANDPTYIANLDSYQAAVSEALKEGKWGVAGGYFEGAWDEAVNRYYPSEVVLQPWWKRWLGGDWGFEHNSALYWFALDDLGITRIYRELVCNKHTPEMLAERIIKECAGDCDENGKRLKYDLFSFAHDAFAQRQDENPIAIRIGRELAKAGIVQPSVSTKDKKGREQILYDKLRGRVRTGQTFNDADGRTEYVCEPALQISVECPYLIEAIPKAPRDEKNREEIAEFLGDDPIAGAGYGLYAFFGRPNQKPLGTRVQERIEAMQERREAVGLPRQTDPTMIAIASRKAIVEERKKDKPVPLITRGRWNRRFHP